MKKILIVGLLILGTVHLWAQLYTPSGTIAGTTGNQNVGIGTNSPTYKLDVTGNLRTSSFINAYEYITVQNGSSYRVAMNGQSDGYVTGRDASNQDKFLIASNGNSYFNGGNVGIGTSAPQGYLHVNPVRPVIIKNNGGNGVYGSEIGFNAVLNTSVVPNQFRKLGGTSQVGGASIAVDYNGSIFYQMYSAGTESESIINYNPQIIFQHTGRVGIGTMNPRQNLHVKGRFYLEGTEAYPSGWLQNYFHWRGHSLIMGSEVGEYAHNTIELKPGGSASGALESYFQIFSTPSPNNHDLKVQLASIGDSFLNGGNVGIGTTNPDAKLAVKGTIHAQEVKVDLNGAVAPDYVFEKDYNLMSLEEIKAYIEKHKHLPEVPSAKEMETNGVNLSEMNMILLKKVEELTLYLIEKDKEIQELKNDIKTIKNEK